MAKDGTDCMAKKQKNAWLDDGLCEVIDVYQRLSGATFPRVVTASFLKYLFGNLEPPVPPEGTPSDRLWMRIAVDIERGDFTIDEVPLRLLDLGIEYNQRWLAHFTHIQKPTEQEKSLQRDWVRRNGLWSASRKRWCDLVADLNGERKAIESVLEHGGFVRPHEAERFAVALLGDPRPIVDDTPDQQLDKELEQEG